jgi:type II secretory pathway pseudopilin PulG
MSGAARRSAGQSGFTLIALMASIAVGMVLLGVAAPSWRYVMRDEREEELIFRGSQIADAIQSYQAKHGNAAPPSLETLVKGRFLRKAYKDPMTPKGEWRLIRQGEPLAPPGPAPSGRPSLSASPPPITRPPGPGMPGAQGIGAIVGVASRSTEKSLRIFNGRKRYDEWYFAAGQPRVVGSTSIIPVPPGAPQQGPQRRPSRSPSGS